MSVNGFLDSIYHDLGFALRRLLRARAFTLVAALTLALGIGATTAIFSVVYSVLIKPLPYENADELVRVRYSTINSGNQSSSHTMYLTYRDENRTFENMGLWQYADDFSTLTAPGEPRRLNILMVTHGTLEALGVQPVNGRWFAETEYGPAAEGPQPVILSYALWQQHFGGDNAVLGSDIFIDSQPARVVGIMPRDFRFIQSTQPDVILAVRRLELPEQTIGWFNYQMLGRLKPGVTPDEARADIERMLPIWLDAWPLVPGGGQTKEAIANQRYTPIVRPLKDDLVGGIAGTLWVLMGAIGAVLLVACANIANLMLVRSEARREELGIRAALGAGPARIARELFLESLALGVAGGVLGWALANVGLEVLLAIAPSDLPRLREIAVYPPVLAFTVATSLASTLVFGSIPVVKYALRIEHPMLGVPRGSSTSRERSTTRSVLVVVQVALALVLIVGAGLMIRSFQELRDIDPGFSDPATIQTTEIWMPGWQYADAAESLEWIPAQRDILDRITALPGVTAAGFTDTLSMTVISSTGTDVEGQTPGPAGAPSRGIKRVSPGYFEAVGTRIVAGRDIAWSDIEAGGRVILISENLAREIAAEPSAALGMRLRAPVGSRQWREIVGVVQNVRENGLYEDPPSVVYYPALMENRWGEPYAAFVIRSQRAGTASLIEEIREAVQSVNGNIAISQARTMRELAAESLARTSFTLVLLAIAGGMGLVLGVIGVYGVITYAVSQRRREIGIRSALGAESRQLKRMFLMNGLVLSGVGVAVGLVIAAALGRVMSSLLFGVSAMDPAAYIGALVVILSAAVLACYLPARRAAMIDPTEALRSE